MGFDPWLQAAGYILSHVQNALKVAAAKAPGWPVLICGHSLGGAWEGWFGACCVDGLGVAWMHLVLS